MTSGLKKHRRVSPMPVTSSFEPIPRITVHSECITRQMTPQEYTDMLEKYGPPKMKLSERKGNHYMTGGKVKK